MTTKEKQGFGLYFLLAFGLAWLCQVGGCMALLQKAHIGEVQSSVWPKEMIDICSENNIHLL